jgi:hypothetical protein
MFGWKLRALNCKISILKATIRLEKERQIRRCRTKGFRGAFRHLLGGGSEFLRKPFPEILANSRVTCESLSYFNKGLLTRISYCLNQDLLTIDYYTTVRVYS